MAEPTGTTVRILSLLRLIAESSGPLGVKDVAGALDLPMSTSHRLLDMLLEAGFVEKDTIRRRYSAGREFFRIASLLAQRTSIARAMQPVLDELTERTGESTILGLYLPAQRSMTYVAKADSPEPLRYRLDLFEQMPLEWGASGLAILAFLPETVQAEVLASACPSPISGRSLSPEEYAARLARVRRDGYARSEGEKIADCIALAVPLGGPEGVVGSLTITTPKFRFDGAKTGFLVDLLHKAARRFTSAGG